MVCTEGSNNGLLYVSGELEAEVLDDYKAHLKECDYCKNELRIYQEERKLLFRPEMFEETPSESVDKEIVRVCTKPLQPSKMFITIPTFVKSSFLAVVVLLVGFSGGIYFAGLKINSENQNNDSKMAQPNKSPSIQSKSQLSGIPFDSSEKTPVMSFSDSLDSVSPLNDSVVKSLRQKGNLEIEGVVPVKVKE